jgi:hypothetical protein
MKAKHANADLPAEVSSANSNMRFQRRISRPPKGALKGTTHWARGLWGFDGIIRVIAQKFVVGAILVSFAFVPSNADCQTTAGETIYLSAPSSTNESTFATSYSIYQLSSSGALTVAASVAGPYSQPLVATDNIGDYFYTSASSAGGTMSSPITTTIYENGYMFGAFSLSENVVNGGGQVIGTNPVTTSSMLSSPTGQTIYLSAPSSTNESTFATSYSIYQLSSSGALTVAASVAGSYSQPLMATDNIGDYFYTSTSSAGGTLSSPITTTIYKNGNMFATFSLSENVINGGQIVGTNPVTTSSIWASPSGQTIYLCAPSSTNESTFATTYTIYRVSPSGAPVAIASVAGSNSQPLVATDNFGDYFYTSTSSAGGTLSSPITTTIYKNGNMFATFSLSENVISGGQIVGTNPVTTASLSVENDFEKYKQGVFSNTSASVAAQFPGKGAWGGQTINDQLAAASQKTMAQAGCTITCLASVASYYGSADPHNPGNLMDPGSMLTFIKSQKNSAGSYINLATTSNSVLFGGLTIPSASGSLSPVVGSLSLNQIGQYVEDNGPMMLRVPSSNPGILIPYDPANDFHFIVAYGVTNGSDTRTFSASDIYISDPGHYILNGVADSPTSDVTLANYFANVASSNGSRYTFSIQSWFTGSTSILPSFFNTTTGTQKTINSIYANSMTTFWNVDPTHAPDYMVVHSPVELLITDERTGQIYVSSADLMQPGYTLLQAVYTGNVDSADGTDQSPSDPFPAYDLQLASQMDGDNLKLTLFGMANGSYQIDYVSGNPAFASSNSLTGNIETGEQISAEFDLTQLQIPEPTSSSMIILGAGAIANLRWPRRTRKR